MLSLKGDEAFTSRCFTCVAQDGPANWNPSYLSAFVTEVVSSCQQQQRTSVCKMSFLDLQALKMDHSKR